MEASITDGNTKKCGGVAGLKTVVNPISLARLVMEKTPHIYLAFDGAEAFAREQLGCTQPTPNDLDSEKSTPNGDSKFGKVGCVAVDSQGNLASATSIGGHVNKMVARIGDTPIIGAGTYANNLCAVSTIGIGEVIIRGTVARDVAAIMEFKGLSLKDAAAYAVDSVQKGTTGTYCCFCHRRSHNAFQYIGHIMSLRCPKWLFKDWNMAFHQELNDI